MGVRRRFLALFALVAAYSGARTWVEGHVEMAMLEVSGRHRDHITRVFVVDDPPAVWVRAERPDRLWLKVLREHPDVDLSRGGVESAYRAEIRSGVDARDHVNRLFREKYGVVDVLAGVVWRRDAVPVRLERH